MTDIEEGKAILGIGKFLLIIVPILIIIFGIAMQGIGKSLESSKTKYTSRKNNITKKVEPKDD